MAIFPEADVAPERLLAKVMEGRPMPQVHWENFCCYDSVNPELACLRGQLLQRKARSRGLSTGVQRRRNDMVTISHGSCGGSEARSVAEIHRP